MPKLKQTFIRGKMNKDLDERLVPKGEYRDGQNIQVSTSEGNDVGAIENVLGNTKQNNKPGSGTWTTKFGLTSPKCIGVVRDPSNEKIYWFVTSASVDAILEYDQTTNIVTPVLVDIGSVLNFNVNNLITGVNILENQLFWTDDLNEPRVINIDTFKAGSVQTGSTLNSTTHVYGTTRDFTAADITVIVKSPNIQATVLAAPSLVGGNATGITPVETTQLNFNTGTPTFKPVAPGTVYNNVAFSAAVLFDAVKQVSLTASLVNELNIIENYEVICNLSNLSSNGLSGTLTVVSASSNVPDKTIPWSMLLIESEPIFKNDFPRFSYRWRYANGEYSTFAPFTKAAFVPNKFQYLSSNGFNEGMDNVTRKITLSNFQTPEAGVKDIDILYKSAVSNNIYVLQTIDLSAGALNTFVITDELLGNVVESSQLLRPWDNVPRKAKSQEVIGNRVVYGNYLQNYDVNAAVDIVAAQVNTAHANAGYGLQSIKTDRTYQIGITFIDEFNRESPVFTNKDASQVVEITNSEKSNTFTAKLNSTAPSWATAFKYYIKEPTAEYYNLALDRFYDSKDGNIWLSFPSSEVNKIQEGEYMLLKKQHDASLPVKSQNRYKILDVRSEAPDYISNQNAIAARTSIATRANSFTVGEKEISFIAPRNDFAEEFYNLFNNQSSVQFLSGVYASKIYNVESGGPGAVDQPNNETQVFGITISEPLATQDSWLQNLGTPPQALEVLLYNKSNQFLPEFQGRFFAKINKNQTFIDNVEVPFTQNSSNIIVDKSESVLTQNTNTDTSQVMAWTDQYRQSGSPYNPPVFKVPTAGAADWTLTVAINIPNTGEKIDMLRALQPGTDVRFFDSNNNFSRVYTVLTSNIPSSGALINATYARNNPSAGSLGFYASIVMTSLYDDTIVPNGIQIVSERVSPDTDVLSSTNPAVFETEPNDIADADIYYEVGKALPIADAGNVNTLNWFNCYSFGNGVESDRIRDDFNAPQMGNGVRVSSTLNEPYEEERKSSSLIFSGIFNSISGVNNTNQFLIAENITKDLNPTYGSIQKLHARDTDLITLLEDKCFRVLANKDALFNADGNSNVTSNNNVLGQTVPFAGEFGISKNPESFASFGFRSYFTDRARGSVIRLSRDGITVISDKNMSYYFNQQLKAATQPLIGSYDEDTGTYNVRLNNKQLSFLETVDGWTTRLTYAPEGAISLNTEYYTFKDGEMWKHAPYVDRNASPLVPVPRSNFYGTQENTAVTTIINDGPSSIKNFKTLSYEGDEGWTAAISTKDQNGVVNTWKEREGIYFNFIEGNNTTLDTKSFSTQGISTVSSTITGNPLVIDLTKEINVSVQVGDTLYYHRSNVSTPIGLIQSLTSTRITAANSGGKALQNNDFLFVSKPTNISTSGLTGYYSTVVMTNTSAEKRELFAVNAEAFISSE